MKQLLLIILIIVPIDAVAAIDSSRAVFDSTFHLGIIVTGSFSSGGPTGWHSNDMESIDLSVTVDPRDTAHYKRIGDTIRWSVSSSILFVGSTSDGVTIVLAPSSLVIESIHVAHTDTHVDMNFHSSDSHNWGIALSNFDFDSSSIFTTDFSFSAHGVFVGYGYSYEGPQLHDNWSKTLDSATTIQLSGAFKAVSLRKLSLKVDNSAAILHRTLSLVRNTDKYECNFEAEHHFRTLEAYSSLGSRVLCYEIPPGETSITIPHLPAGLYFIRLGDQVTKVWEAE